MPQLEDFSAQADQTAEAQEPAQTPAQKTYTQADIDNIVGKIKHAEKDKVGKLLAAERQRAIQEWREENGLTDEIISSVANKDTHQLELKKRENALKKLEEELSSAKQSESRIKELLHSHVAKNSVYEHAIANNSNDPDTVFLWLKDQIEFDEELKPYMRNGETIEDAVKGLLRKKPNLVKSSVEHGGGGVKGGTLTAAEKEDMKTPEGRMRALMRRGWQP